MGDFTGKLYDQVKTRSISRQILSLNWPSLLETKKNSFPERERGGFFSKTEKWSKKTKSRSFRRPKIRKTPIWMMTLQRALRYFWANKTLWVNSFAGKTIKWCGGQLWAVRNRRKKRKEVWTLNMKEVDWCEQTPRKRSDNHFQGFSSFAGWSLHVHWQNWAQKSSLCPNPQ